MKPGKTRLQRRKQARRWLALGDELERNANLYAQARNKAVDQPAELRAARHKLFLAALDFATAVDGEE